MKSDGGPAFPTARKEDGIDWTEDGMSLRDWFAGQALFGFLAASKGIGWGSPTEISKKAYGFADAMIAEHDK